MIGYLKFFVKMKLFTILAALFVLFFVAGSCYATESNKITLTITPPLIKNNINPGQTWQSYIKLINNNAEEIKAYAQVADFKSANETGGIEFLPKAEEGASSQFRLSQWLVIEKGPFVIAPFQSIEIPFTISVPEGAEPGGHNAAILVGTNPPEGQTTGTVIKVSSLIASLLLIDVAGDTTEKADIREFSPSKNFYTDKNINFTVRIENKGNIHVLPQGQIKITDFWGKEKGLIPMNQNTSFGNVLPGAIRKWSFDWQAGDSLMDMGKYRADLVINYGTKAVETLEQKTYFWVIYVKPLAILGGSITGFILFVYLFIRWNVRRAMKAVQAQMGAPMRQSVEKRIVQAPRVVKKITPTPSVKPVQKIEPAKRDNGVIDLRKK